MIISTGNALTVTFSSDGSITKRGFRAVFSRGMNQAIKLTDPLFELKRTSAI